MYKKRLYPEAMEYLRKVLDLDPQHIEANKLLNEVKNKLYHDEQDKKY
jgi:hypothetical protein